MAAVHAQMVETAAAASGPRSAEKPARNSLVEGMRFVSFVVTMCILEGFPLLRSESTTGASGCACSFGSSVAAQVGKGQSASSVHQFGGRGLPPR